MGLNLGSSEISDLKLGSSQVSKIYYSGQTIWPSEDPIWEDLVSYYRFEDNTNDSKGSNNLTNNNCNFIAGKENQCIVQTGSTQSVVAADNTVFEYEYDVPWSWSMWYKRVSINNLNGLSSKQQTGDGNYGYFFGIYTDNKLRVVFIGTSPGGVNIHLYSTTTLTDTSNWHHVAWTYSGSGTAAGNKVYLDGSLLTMTVETDNLNGTILNTATWSQRYDNNSSYNPHGYMDELGHWTRELSASEISDLYNSGSGKFY